MSITASQVKELREMSGAGMMDAKAALVENNGDMTAAMDWLRTKGLAKAAKKSDRVAAEGLVAISVKDGVGVAVEVNSETDFVAKNAEFQDMVSVIADAAHGADSHEELLEVDIDGKPVGTLITDKVATIGENMGLRRMVKIEGDSIATYVHTAVKDGMGRIGAMVALKGTDNGIGKQIAMHIAAHDPRPVALAEGDVDPSVLEKERQIQIDIAKESGKPDNVIEKMIEGRMKKYLQEITLLNQNFVINPDLTVAQAAKEAGVEIQGFARIEVGEGVEKKEEDFAAEVAKTAKGE